MVKGVKDIELIPPELDAEGRYALRMKNATSTPEQSDNHPSRMIDLTLLETNNHEWAEKNFGLEAALGNIYRELDEQMNMSEV